LEARSTTSAEQLFPQEIGHLEDHLQGCAYSGSAPQNKPLWRAPFLPIISLTSRTIKISGSRCQEWNKSPPVEGGLRRGKFSGEIHFFFAFFFAIYSNKTTYTIGAERFPQRKGSESTSFGAK
jgi:hypothetical protein